MNSEEKKTLLAQLEKSKESLFTTLENVNKALFLYQPPNDRWSIAELVEHIILVDQRVLNGIQKFGSTPSEEEIITPFDNGELVKLVGTRTRKVEAPVYFIPKGTFLTKEAAIEAFEAHYASIYDFMNTTDLPLKRIGFPHALLGVLNGVNWLAFLGGHCDRHVEQMEEIKEAYKVL